MFTGARKKKKEKKKKKNGNGLAAGCQLLSTSMGFEIWLTFDEGQRMTLTFDTHSTS